MEAIAAMTLRELAEHIANAIGDGARVRRLVLEFLTEYASTGEETRQRLLDDPPASTHDDRWDAFLAAMGEHLAFHGRLGCPPWTQQPERFLDRWWFLSDTPSGRAEALVTAPASFRRRGVFIEARDLERV